MNWGSADAFFAMGGYGLYVWGSYGMTALCMVLEIWSLLGKARPGRAVSGERKTESL